MKQGFRTKPSLNGNIFYLFINHKEKTFSKGYNLGFHACYIVRKKDILDMIKYDLLLNDYKEI